MHSHLVWDGHMGFLANGDSGHVVKIDVAVEVGGLDEAARPMELVLHGLGGCTGADVVSILGKMQVDFSKMEISIDAERADEHPKRFTKIVLTYRFWGSAIDPEKVKRAIELSQTKYCSVAASLNAEIGYKFVLNP